MPQAPQMKTYRKSEPRNRTHCSGRHLVYICSSASQQKVILKKDRNTHWGTDYLRSGINFQNWLYIFNIEWGNMLSWTEQGKKKRERERGSWKTMLSVKMIIQKYYKWNVRLHFMKKKKKENKTEKKKNTTEYEVVHLYFFTK